MYKSTEIKVGLFAIVGATALIMMVIMLDGNPFVKKNIDYYTELENVGGIGVRTQVRVSGVMVGTVTSIDVLSKTAKVNFEIKSDVEIPEGSFLELRSRGILGDVYLELVRNSQATKVLPEGSFIPKRSEASDFNSLMTMVGSIARDLQQVSRSLAMVFGSSDGQSALQNILHNIEKISADTSDLIKSQKANITDAIENLRKSAYTLSDMLDSNSGNIAETVETASTAVKDIQQFTSELKKLITGKNEHKLESILDSVESSVNNVREAMGKVQLIVDKVQKGEGTLGQIISKDDAANDIRATLKSVQELLAPARRLQVEIDYKGEMRTKVIPNINTFGNHVNLRLKTRPDQYYLLGLSDSQGARQVSTTVTTTENVATNAVATKEEVTTNDNRGALRYNVQFAKRFAPVGVRFGLFESYPGVAADLYLFDDKFTASVEAFQFTDYRTNQRRLDAQGFARIKAYGNVYVTDNLYVTGGVDNIGRATGVFGFFGGGLRFTDDDLKSVLGTASLLK